MNPLKKLLPFAWRHQLRRLWWALRPAFAGLRAGLPVDRLAPSFLILGAQKGGTTTLYDALCQHPHVARAVIKEVHFFNDHWARGENWYRAHFPYSRPGDIRITGEATPEYLDHPEAPARVKSLLPDAKFIVLLRDPVRRTLSHHLHTYLRRREKLPLHEALRAEEQRLAAEGDWGQAHKFFSYVRRSFYAEQLARWFKHFPRDQFYICRSEDFFADPQKTYGEILVFLGLPPHTPHIGKLNANGETAILAIPPDLPAKFEKPNADLVSLLGPQFRWP